MIPLQRVIYLVSSDATLNQRLINQLLSSGTPYQLPLAASVAQARKACRCVTPAVILLDESAVQAPRPPEEKHNDSFDSAVASLTECAPVVVVAAPERQSELAFFISSAAVDFVARVGDFVPVAVAVLERRVRLAEQIERAQSMAGFPPAELRTDFGEILRHEVNNPLTGILGNAEAVAGRVQEEKRRAALRSRPPAPANHC